MKLAFVAAAHHGGAWGRLARAFKKDPHPDTEGLFAGAIETLVRRARRRLAPLAIPEWEILFVPVPMAAVRRRERGQNPAERLARLLAIEWNEREPGAARVESRALRRVRYHGPLRGRSAKERRAEMDAAIVPGPAARSLEGRRVVLVDDVITTGATLLAAASAIEALGGQPSLALALSRTPPARVVARARKRVLASPQRL